MHLKFDPNQSYQLDAISSVVDVFEGIPHSSHTSFLSSEINNNQPELLGSELVVGNDIFLPQDVLTQNTQNIQIRNGLPISQSIDSSSYNFPNFTVEMETGTGKTYVYLRTIFELHKRFGYKKFIIIVPNIAIREGVIKNIDITKQHFKDIYDNISFNSFVYDSKRPGSVRQFAMNDSLQIMVINIQAFQRDVDSVSDERSAALFNRGGDQSIRSPREYVQQTNPIVILDEPQSIDTTVGAKRAISGLNPLFVLRYSATHREPYNLMYKLDPVKAFELGLVKQIAVSSLEDIGYKGSPYLKVVSIENTKGIAAKIRIFKQGKTSPESKIITARHGNDLYTLSGNLDIYKNNFIISEINCEQGNEFVAFSNGQQLALGEESGGTSDEVRKMQMRITIREHLDKELRLRDRGIKVLTLFFIDQVSHYRIYDEQNNYIKGKYAMWFEELYDELTKLPQYAELRSKDLHIIHDGYFAQDKHGKWKDTRGDSSEDLSVYEKIMRQKEVLLSLEEPLRFIFSHSALREGWDNPNVFQICTLNQTTSQLRKRQEIGRGLRIPVDKNGERVFDNSINKLVVIANESYEQFVSDLQKQYKEDGVEFGKLSTNSFTIIPGVTIEASERLYYLLISSHILNVEGNIAVSIDEKINYIYEVLEPDYSHSLVQIIDLLKKFDIHRHIKNSSHRTVFRLNKDVYYSPEFMALWKAISVHTDYSVCYDSEIFTARCIQSINEMPRIEKPSLVFKKVDLHIVSSGVSLTETRNQIISFDSFEELPDILSYIQERTFLTRDTIYKILIGCNRLQEFSIYPQKFMDLVVRCIDIVKVQLIGEGIDYHKNEDSYSLNLFETEKEDSFIENVVASNKSVYFEVACDSESERRFVSKLNNDDSIVLFVKLPLWFKIRTPVGAYTPDWAIVKKENSTICFMVRETKSTLHEEQRRGEENIKIACGRKHFEVLGVDYKDIAPPFTSSF